MLPWHSGDGGQEGELEIAQERKGKAFYRDMTLSASPLCSGEGNLKLFSEVTKQ